MERSKIMKRLCWVSEQTGDEEMGLSSLGFCLVIRARSLSLSLSFREQKMTWAICLEGLSPTPVSHSGYIQDAYKPFFFFFFWWHWRRQSLTSGFKYLKCNVLILENAPIFHLSKQDTKEFKLISNLMAALESIFWLPLCTLGGRGDTNT